MGYTKGKWFEKTDFKKDSHYRIFSEQKNTLDSPIEICLVHRGLDTHDCRANARIIAASPELMEACKYTLDGLTETREGHFTLAEGTIKKLQQAIALAEEER